MRTLPSAAILEALILVAVALISWVDISFAQDSQSETALEEEVTLDAPTQAPSPPAEGTNPVSDAAQPTPEEPKVMNPSEATTAIQEAEAQESADQQEEEEQVAEEDPAPQIQQPNALTAVAPADSSAIAVKSSSGGRLFGRKRVQLAVNKPNFTQNKEVRESLYGKPKDYPTLTGDWFPLDWWINPGLAFRMGGYSASGRAAKGTPTQEDIDSGNITVDENQKTTLLFIPFMAAAKVEMTPFRDKWLVLDGWFGYEYGWWQETRNTSSAIAWRMATTDPVSTTKGTKTALVMGGSANFLLNWLDERTVRSMVETMGISNVYISPFFEVVRGTSKSGISFNRNTLGLGFTFETYR